MKALEPFLPATRTWFAQNLGEPTNAQVRAWPLIARGKDMLLAAPTGSGKTLAAFLCAIDDLLRRGLDERLRDELSVLYISPLKALSNDVEKNLRAPLAGIAATLEATGQPHVTLRAEVRTGDTPSHVRSRMIKKPPHILVTTPESLYILLTSEGGRRMLQTVESVIVDEIHALAGDKRGSHLALSLCRLDRLVEAQRGKRPTRIGLSATQRPIELVAHFLTGTDRTCAIVDEGHRRALDIRVEVPNAPIETVLSHEVWEEIFDRLQALIEAHKSTLIFANTRRLTERIAKGLSERLGDDAVTAHHGSLSRRHRLRAEQRLKDGSLAALVATASLEMGIDIGDVDLVCQIGSTRSIAGLLQRVGRASHQVNGVPKGRIFPLSRDELVEAAAAMDAIARGELDALEVPSAPIDILAQQIVASVAQEEFELGDLFALVRQSYPYRDLRRQKFDDVIDMLSSGFATKRGRRAAYLHLDGVGGKVRARKHARLTAITNGGAIPELADYEVLLEPEGFRVGTLNEDFAIESMAGDIFQLGNTSYRIRRVEPGKVRVEDAKGAPPNIPFWLGEAPSRSAELSAAVSRLRADISESLSDEGLEPTIDQVGRKLALSDAAAKQLCSYVAVGKSTLGMVPTQSHLMVERFFDEAENMHIVLHTPFGGRINRAWGLSLRKRFCRTFNFELQAAANEDAIVLSLGPTHSFPIDEVWHFLKPESIEHVLRQAVLDSPMFESRWRWNSTRSLAVPRFQSGKKVAPALQRMRADDLLTVVFPDQVACAENLQGEREVPDHPLVEETMDNCLHEAMDVDGLRTVLSRIASGEICTEAKDVKEPSAFAAAVINVRPYAFLDDAPLEERRTQAILSRRWLDPTETGDLGRLDPEAIEEVRKQAWPQPRDADELHDALVLHRGFGADVISSCGWDSFFEELCEQKRAGRLCTETSSFAVAAESLPLWLAVHPAGQCEPSLAVPERNQRQWSVHDAGVELVRGQLDARGPVTETALANALGLSPSAVRAALATLENEGVAFRLAPTTAHDEPFAFVADREPDSSEARNGRGARESALKVRAQAPQSVTLHREEDGSRGVTKWCERRLLARIHRYTLDRLRKQIQPVSAAAFVRFLCEWQRVSDEHRLEGNEGLFAVIEQLQGLEAPLASWDDGLLRVRVKDYTTGMLDRLCATGRIAWAKRECNSKQTSLRASSLTFAPRRDLKLWLTPNAEPTHPDTRAAHVLEVMQRLGPSFFDEIVEESELLPSQLEQNLRDLAASGWIGGDGTEGLRVMLLPEHKRRSGPRSRAKHALEPPGRWSLMRRKEIDDSEAHAAELAHALLRRWGVLFRALIDRESGLPPWRDLLWVLRRLEARGEVRGGRFVAGFAGEQFALPEAVTPLRRQRNKKDGSVIRVCAHDPLNLPGFVLPGGKLPRVGDNALLLRDGREVARMVSGEVEVTDQEQPLSREEATKHLRNVSRASKTRHREPTSHTSPKISDIADAR